MTSTFTLSNIEQMHEAVHYFNPFLMNGFSHHYHLDVSTIIFRGIMNDFDFLFHFSMKFL